MIRSLEYLQSGHINPLSFQRVVGMDRVYSLKLSQHSEMEPFYFYGITTMDIDRIEDRYLLSGGKDGSICIHDLVNTSDKPYYKSKVARKVKSKSRYAHRLSVMTVQWYPFDTGLFLSSSMDNSLKIWDTNSMKPADTIKLDYKINCHHMSSIVTQHSLIAVALSQPHVVLVDPRSGAKCHELRAHSNMVNCVKWSPCSEYLLASGGIDNKIFFWDVRSAKGYLQSLDQHNGEAVGSRKDLRTAHNGAITSMSFTEDGLHLVSYGSDKRLRLWDVALHKNTLVNYGHLPISGTREFAKTFDLFCGTTYPVIFVPFSNFINIYDLFTGSKIKSLVGHFGAVSSCVFRQSTHQLFSGGNDKTILIWSSDTDNESVAKKAYQEELRPAGGIDEDNWSSDE